MVYRLRVLRVSQGGIGVIQTGRRLCLCSCREEGDWEVNRLMQLLGILFRSLDWYENSDLKSKCSTGTGYILLVTPSE